MGIKYKALVVRESGKQFTRAIEECDTDNLPEGDVLIRVKYSSLNYKDALSARGHYGITRKYPHTPGIDASGIVVESKSTAFSEGDKVLVTGYDLGMNTWGGFGQYIRVPADWVVKLPETFDLKTAMIYGTAGFTAGICIYEFQTNDIQPFKGNVLVTGATGGVGSLAVAMLSKLGYYVIASTGKQEQFEFLKGIGVKEVLLRDDLNKPEAKPLLPKKWIGAIDTVGGMTLANVIKSTDRRGVVCSVGLVESDTFSITVYPFIIRGIRLIGIDSAERPMSLRKKIWENIATQWAIDKPEKFVKEVSLEELSPEIDKILMGKITGRVVVNLD